MSKKRYKSTHFWEDNYVTNLDPLEKLLFGYLLDNPMVSILGVYEFHPRRIAFETGLDADMVNKMLARFARDGKIVLIEGGYVCLLNRPKHQSTGGSIDNPTAKGIIREFQELPAKIKKQIPRTFYESVQAHWGKSMLEKWSIVLEDIPVTEVDDDPTMGHTSSYQVPTKEPEDSLPLLKPLLKPKPNGNTASRKRAADKKSVQDLEKVDSITKLYYEAIKSLGLPTPNHDTLRKKIASMKGEAPEEDLIVYLEFMRDKFAVIKIEYKPDINTAFDIYTKRLSVVNAFKRAAEEQKPRAWRPRTA
ncbi:MAG TPA: hypothetical protein VNG51_19320 [Ktedonobacteraceae bacterium]|nr:hypothetical protein [Ktedonobacteraceae bacterium]